MSQEQSPAGAAALGRYQDLGLIGQGSMAEVRRVWDPALDRAVAMKILRMNLVKNPLAASRFKKEARAIARLQHPGVIPIHDLGVLPDGRPYYTMGEIEGRTLAALLRELRAGAPAEGWGERRLVETVLRASEAVAFAHARGILHRDLKPDNVLVGRFGEVLVVDWGLAKAFGEQRPLVNTGAVNTADVSAAGSVSGTPAYMAPEQAVAGPVSPATDVYALGAVLYEILAGKPPYAGPNAWLVLLQLKTGAPPSLRGLPGVSAPPELLDIIERAMERDPAQRFPDAGALASALAAWLDGARKRERAQAHMVQAEAKIAEVQRRHLAADALRAEARAALAALPSYAPVADKRPWWERQAAAVEEERQAGLAEREAVVLLTEALTEAPQLAEAQDRLAELYRARQAAAEARGDRAAAAEAEALLRAADRGAHRAWLEGRAELHLSTEPAGATALLFRYVERDRRLVPVFERSLGGTPLVAAPLERGSWRVDLCLPGFGTVRYPVQVGRLERYSEAPVQLHPERALRATEILVPAGPFWSGEGEARARVRLESWVVARVPVTHRDYLGFLNALVAEGRVDEALRYAPRREGGGGEQGLVYGWSGQGFSLPPVGPSISPDHPVTRVDHVGATAYAAWLAAQDGRPWQLLPQRVWEKAARGVDGRAWPWGEAFDPTFCNMAESGRAPGPVPVGSVEADVSPYGVQDLAGNVSEWCQDEVNGPGEVGPGRRVIRGGSWRSLADETRIGRVELSAPDRRSDRVGMRVGWPIAG